MGKKKGKGKGNQKTQEPVESLEPVALDTKPSVDSPKPEDTVSN